MSEAVKLNPARLAPPPPAAGHFGLFPAGSRIDLSNYRPSGCPTIEQFENQFVSAGDRRRSGIA